MWFLPDVLFLLSITTGDSGMMHITVFIMIATYQAELCGKPTRPGLRTPALTQFCVCCCQGLQGTMQPRDYFFFLLVSQFMDPLEGQVIQSRTQNILEWLQILRKDFFLPRAQAEMNFSMEPVWIDLLTSLMGVSPSGGIRLMRGPTPNPSLTRAETSLRPQKGC